MQPPPTLPSLRGLPLPAVNTTRVPAKLPSLKHLAPPPPPALPANGKISTDRHPALFDNAPQRHTSRSQLAVTDPSVVLTHGTSPGIDSVNGKVARRTSPVPPQPSSDSPTSSGNDDTSSSTSTSINKRSRRKEQCRVNQANYRKRKRNYEQQLAGYIESLEHDIDQLTSHKQALDTAQDDHSDSPAHSEPQHPETEIQALYASIDADAVGLLNYGLRAQFSLLVSLQLEEFASIEDMQYEWSRHKRQFQVFRLRPLRSERLSAGEHSIVKLEAELEIWFTPASENGDGSTDIKRVPPTTWWSRPFTCPVQHRFEFDEHSQRIARITSEVNFVAGVAGVAKSSSMAMAQVLNELLGA